MAYIDSEKLKKNIRVNLMPNVDVDGTVTVENAERYFLNLIDKTSTAEVAEVKHGEWYVTEYEYLNCSICGEAMYTGCNSTQEANLLKDHWKSYCPNCGAKMDGGKTNDNR